MAYATTAQIDEAMRRLGHYRVVRAQEQAEKVKDAIGGAVILAMGLRETWGRNIEGGAKQVDGRWVAETDPTRMDVGWLQISRRYNAEALKRMPGVKVKTWSPVVEGKSAYDAGYVPRYTDALVFTVDSMTGAYNYAVERGYKNPLRFAVAAHNAGIGGAAAGYREGNVDKYTAGGDYSAWVMDARTKVRAWIKDHPNWAYVEG